MSKQIIWHKIASSANEIPFLENGMVEIEIGGKKVCLVLRENNIYACATKCPHAGGKMSAGYIDTLGNIVCPLHRYKFSIMSGRNVSGEGYFLKTYKIEHRESGVFIGFENDGMFSWLK
ncbi:MAG: Rieske 2Fe-2S domain-containing protein [Ferruginibacter sp.]